MRRFIIALTSIVALPFLVFAQNEAGIKTPQEIQAELDRDEVLFKHAQEMFNPWYAGPLITGGAHNMPPGAGNIQTYLFFTDNYALWNSERDTVNTTDRYVLNPEISSFTFGITDWLDFAVVVQGFANWQGHKASGGFGDTLLGIGIPIVIEGLYKPAIRFVFNEIFPSGRYEKLRPHLIGLDATGAGSYQSQFGLRLSKLVFWSYKHPINFRFAYSYTIPSRVHVQGFNNYGGGYGASGTVNPGNSQQGNFALEYSFTQNWVFACDLVYVWSDRTTFHGNPGVLKGGTPSVVGGGSNDQLSIAPAIEYNPTATLNFLAGVWFDVYGRNTPKFISGIVSVSYGFNW